MTSIDWASLRQIAEEGTRPLPAGEYTAVVESAEAKVASTGSQMIAVKFKILGGPHDGRIVFTNIVLSTTSAFALNLFFQKLDALGCSREWFSANNPTMDHVANQITDCIATIEVSIRTWQGTERNEVKTISPAADPGVAGGMGINFGMSGPSKDSIWDGVPNNPSSDATQFNPTMPAEMPPNLPL